MPDDVVHQLDRVYQALCSGFLLLLLPSFLVNRSSQR